MFPKGSSTFVRKLSAALFYAQIFVLTFATTPAIAAPALCRTPSAFLADADTMPHVAATAIPGRTLTILAVGSAGMRGPSFLPAEASFPARMLQALHLRLPSVEIRMTVLGETPGLTATAMVRMMRTTLARGHTALVIWQTGTVEAVRETPPQDFAATLEEGAQIVQRADADLILVNPQFSRFLEAHVNIDPYLDAFEDLAALPGVSLFDRWGLMEAWAETDNRLDFERAPSSQQPNVAAALQACIGQALARFILAGAMKAGLKH